MPELLLEVRLRTDFANEYTHVSERHARLDDLPISLYAMLLAEACTLAESIQPGSFHPLRDLEDETSQGLLQEAEEEPFGT